MFDQDMLAAPAKVADAAIAATPQLAGSKPGDLFPCPCVKGHTGGRCGQATVITNRLAARSSAVQDTVRCAECVQNKHYGTIDMSRPRTSDSIEATPKHIVLSAEEQAEEDKAMQDTKDLLYKSSYEKWNLALDERWREAETDDPHVDECFNRLKNGATVGTGLILWGSVGKGKTWRAYAYARRVVTDRLFKPEQVIVGNERDLLGAIDNAPTWGPESKSVKLAKLLAPGVRMYVVDDVGNGATFVSEQSRIDLWTALLDRVYNTYGRTTLVITTNKVPSKFLVDTNNKKILGADGQELPGELRTWVGEVAFSKLTAPVNGHTQMVNDKTEENPTGSYRKKIEQDREDAYQQSLKAARASADNPIGDPAN